MRQHVAHHQEWRPTIADGIKAVECDAIYFFMMAGHRINKRIQRHLDGLSILSDKRSLSPD
ncbi:hypothetical protein N1Z41_00035875 [Pseudomonas aeruginosa]